MASKALVQTMATGCYAMLGSETERLALDKLERSNELFVCVRRYLRLKPSLRELVKTMAERGVSLARAPCCQKPGSHTYVSVIEIRCGGEESPSIDRRNPASICTDWKLAVGDLS